MMAPEDIEYTPRHCGFCAREFKTRGARVAHENRCWTEQRIRDSVVAAVARAEREDAAPSALAATVEP